MKYYIKNNEKIDFYLLGELDNGEFNKGFGLKLLESYPYLISDIEFIDENWDIISTEDFFNMVEKSNTLSKKEEIEREIKRIREELNMGSFGNRNHLDGWVTKDMEDKLAELKEKLKPL